MATKAPSENWYIEIDMPFAGLSPAYWANTYASFGNKNMARSMNAIDLSDPTGFSQGPALANLTNGTGAGGALSGNITHILGVPPQNGFTFGVGGNYLYPLSPTAVTQAGSWPHEITGQSGIEAESSVLLEGKLYYVYNYTGAGDIGQYDLASTFVDNWGSTGPATGAAALVNAPHPSIVGNDNNAYIGNGSLVACYDPDSDTLTVDCLDVPGGSQVVDLRYLSSRVWIAVNFPNYGGSNQTTGIIYVWEGEGIESWDDTPNPRIQGTIGALYAFGGTMFVWYQEVGFTGGYKLGYIKGNSIAEVAQYSGTLPNFAQVFEHQNCLAWVSNGTIMKWGSSSSKIPVALSKYMNCGYSTVGGAAVPFGSVMIASSQSGLYRLAAASGLDTTSDLKTLMFGVGRSVIDKIAISYGPLASGAAVNIYIDGDQGLLTPFALNDNNGNSGISAANDATICEKMFNPSCDIANEFGLDFDFSVGSASNPVLIRKVKIWGHSNPAE